MILRNAGKFLTLAILVANLTQATVRAAAPAKVPDASISRAAGGKVELTPPEQHHFNLKAPNKVEMNGKAIKASILEQKIRFTLPKDVKGGTVDATLFLCDEARSYCVRKVQKFEVR